jgi:hypothetical protein
MMDGEIPDYTDEVQYIDRQPIFWGKYSHVYKGTLRGETVRQKRAVEANTSFVDDRPGGHKNDTTGY